MEREKSVIGTTGGLLQRVQYVPRTSSAKSHLLHERRTVRIVSLFAICSGAAARPWNEQNHPASCYQPFFCWVLFLHFQEITNISAVNATAALKTKHEEEVQEKNARIAQLERELEQRNNQNQSKDTQIKQKNTLITQKDAQITQLERDAQRLSQERNRQTAQIETLQRDVATLHRNVQDADERRTRELNAAREAATRQLQTAQQAATRQLQATQQAATRQLSWKNQTIKSMTKVIQKLIGDYIIQNPGPLGVSVKMLFTADPPIPVHPFRALTPAGPTPQNLTAFTNAFQNQDLFQPLPAGMATGIAVGDFHFSDGNIARRRAVLGRHQKCHTFGVGFTEVEVSNFHAILFHGDNPNQLHLWDLSGRTGTVVVRPSEADSLKIGGPFSHGDSCTISGWAVLITPHSAALVRIINGAGDGAGAATVMPPFNA